MYTVNLILRVCTSATRATAKTLTEAGHVALKFCGKSSDSKTVSLLSFVFASRCCNLKACSNEANIMQRCWANNVA